MWGRGGGSGRGLVVVRGALQYQSFGVYNIKVSVFTFGILHIGIFFVLKEVPITDKYLQILPNEEYILMQSFCCGHRNFDSVNQVCDN